MPGEFDVNVIFTPQATAELLDVTAANIGRRLGVVVDGELTLAGTIISGVSEGVLYYNISEQEARSKVLGFTGIHEGVSNGRCYNEVFNSQLLTCQKGLGRGAESWELE